MVIGLTEVLASLSDALWGPWTAGALTAAGLFLSFQADWIPFRKFPLALRTVFGGAKRRKAAKGCGGAKDTASPFEALSLALGGTVGTGNIVGVAVALSMGGPGAVFWMWAAGLAGMGVKYAEIVLAVRFRERRNGGFVGGPMYVIQNGLGTNFRWLAAVFCVCGALAAFGIGCCVQMGGILTAFRGLSGTFPGLGRRFGRLFPVLLGVTMAVLAAFTLKRRGKAAARVVPFMAGGYILAALAVIFAHLDRLPAVLWEIIHSALSREAVTGGTAGAALSWGLRRGMFSNEAGLGSSPIAHASADAESPAGQGLWGVFEVFADTIVMCTLTALAVLTSGVAVPFGTPAGAEVCAAALATVLGPGTASVFVAAAMVLFGYTSILGWSCYGERCVSYLWGEGAERWYRGAFLLAAGLAPVLDFRLILRASDVGNALMMLPNMTAVLLLSSEVRQETRKRFGKG